MKSFLSIKQQVLFGVGVIFSFNVVAAEATTLSSQNATSPQKIEELSVENSAIKVDKKNPYLMIESVATLTFKRFANESSKIKTDPNILKDIVREELMPYINYKYSAYKVIGVQLKNTSKEERDAFVLVFRDYLISSYAQVFTLYDNQEVEFFPEQSLKDKNIVAVNTRVIMPNRDDIDIAFKVRKNRKTNEWKAFDMVAEGVSLLDSKQAELGGVIRQKGLPHVTALLKEKSQRDIVFKSSKG
jgi:phospholipid transport system substrate-binding protein|tara:strand:+ start:62 stop:793 length:732 start_codon:yes stop_codon:yes gene_type:complete